MSTGTDPGIALDLDWPGIDHAVAAVASRVRAGGAPDVVVGVLRGGMIPAVMIAHRLGVREVIGIEVTRTLSDLPHAAKTDQPTVGGATGLERLTDRDVLLVDDVAGSGATMRTANDLVREFSPARVRLATMVVNTTNWAAGSADSNPLDPFTYFDYVGHTCAGWVRFPWENR